MIANLDVETATAAELRAELSECYRIIIKYRSDDDTRRALERAHRIRDAVKRRFPQMGDPLQDSYGEGVFSRKALATLPVAARNPRG